MEEYPDFEVEFEKSARVKKRSKAELYLERKRLRDTLGDENLFFDHW
ncbi:hypothetical protein [Endozoicomonas sp.]|nr:hypothetical protein [Endozoicomonas sp.]